MSRILRWLIRGLGLGLVAGLLALAIGWYLVSRSLPDYDATVVFPALSAPVEIVRDASAVPHIRAASRADAFFAMGVVHAQDRLWQMEINRRAAQGRLSELLGERTVALDRLVKTLDLYGYASRALAYQSDEARAALDAYARGVNAWIAHVNEAALGRGAPEFFLFGEGGLSPWTPADSLAILKLMALRLTGAARNEIRRATFLLNLPPEDVADILPDYPGPASVTPPRYSALFPGASFRAARAAPAPSPQDPMLARLGVPMAPERAGASNAWAVDQSRSSTGKPLLANDPHLWLSAPGVWYLIDVAGGDLAAIGGSLPGVPVVLIGRNRQLGWGLTTANVDDQDLFIEQLDPADPTRYRTPDGWAAFQTRSIRIDIAGQGARIETVRQTRHGPVLTHNMLGAAAVTPDGHVAALRWTALADRDETFTAALRMMFATGIDDAFDAAKRVLAPAQNVMLADAREIAMVTAGAIPRRKRASPSRGRVPSPGWDADADWIRIQNPLRNPRFRSPESGALANANNRLTDSPYPNNISFDWGRPYRIERLEKELSARPYHSRDSFAALQADAVSEMARSVLPLIARDLWWRTEAREAESALDRRRKTALERLANWTGEMTRHGPEPLIFYEWMRQLTRRLAADELGPLFAEIDGIRPIFVERVFRDVDGAARWCDVDKTPARETCAQMAAASLDDALIRLADDYGGNVDGWRWGAAHVAEHVHMPLGHFGPLAAIFSIRQETSGGDFTLMRGQTPGHGRKPFRNVHAAGLRVVYDFADLDRSVMIASTGQSGHPFSRFYDNLSDAWARGDVIPMSMNDEANRAGAVGVMRLVPNR